MRYVFSVCLALGAGAVQAEPVVVFAAASLKEPVDALAATLGDVVVSYGGSGALARQIQNGAPADVVLLANAEWMDVLPMVQDVADFASNALVLIGPAGAADVDFADLPAALGAGRLAIGATASVPAGIYGREGFESLGLWDDLSGRLAEVDNVRAALVLVARGETPFGVVYATDAEASENVRVVARFPAQSHAPIRYIGGVVTQNTGGQAFWDALRGPQGQAILADFGYLPVGN
ncbi:molybdate ABC transporter substrate-binding protein [Yoonia sp. MH D7]